LYNSLKYAKILEDVGLPRNQAETHIQIISEVLEEELATKQDIMRLEAGTKQDIMRLGNSTKQDIMRLETKFNRLEDKIEKLEYKLIFKLGSLMTVLFGAALGVFSLVN